MLPSFSRYFSYDISESLVKAFMTLVISISHMSVRNFTNVEEAFMTLVEKTVSGFEEVSNNIIFSKSDNIIL